MFEGQIIENRSADSHDVLGTFAAATRSPWRDQPPANTDAFLAWLKSVNAQVMQQRPDKNPGEWKSLVNQAGSTVFVLPELVPGTLREGYERIAALADPVARALMTMFVVTEVHPFVDGNGRTARLAMNAVLTAQGCTRIIVPTVYREDYLLPLKALSNNADPIPFIAAMKPTVPSTQSSSRRPFSCCTAFRRKARKALPSRKWTWTLSALDSRWPKRAQRSYVMKIRVIDGVEVQRGSGNVYADLGLPDAEKLKIKTGLVIEIREAIRRLGLTQQAAAERMGITQPKVSDMMRGEFSNLSERKLMDCLTRLGYDIEIRLKQAAEPVGHLKIALA